MTDPNGLFPGPRGLVVATMASILMVACGGNAPSGSESEMETDTGSPATSSDFIDRQLPNPAREVILNWAPLPDGREWGSTAGIDIGPDGHIWTYDRCGSVALAGGCEDNPDLDPIFKFNKDTGAVMTSFGAGLFVLPHGLHVDTEGNVWVTDSQGNEAGTKGHQVIKFSPEGEVLLRLGTAGHGGSGEGQLNEPCDVIVAPNGDIFVADGHSGQNADPPPGATARIVKFDRDGNFIMEWGSVGFRPGEFRTPHALEFDSQGRLYVADRGNHRIQIFSQDGELLDTYEQFSRVSGLFITDDDTLYAIDSESNPERHPGWRTGVRIGRAGVDRLTAFVPPHVPESGALEGVAGEGVAVDGDGNIYAAEGPASRATARGGITKYVVR
jgi:DNA-binding beta-propeller fold protein YncE